MYICIYMCIYVCIMHVYMHILRLYQYPTLAAFSQEYFSNQPGKQIVFLFTFHKSSFLLKQRRTNTHSQTVFIQSETLKHSTPNEMFPKKYLPSGFKKPYGKGGRKCKSQKGWKTPTKQSHLKQLGHVQLNSN